MTSEELKHEPPIIVRGRRAGLGPLRRELIPTYARWQTDLEVLRGMGTSGQVPRVEATEAWYEQATRPDSTDVYFTVYDLDDLAPVGTALLVPRHATFALLTISPRRRSRALRFRQAI